MLSIFNGIHTFIQSLLASACLAHAGNIAPNAPFLTPSTAPHDRMTPVRLRLNFGVHVQGLAFRWLRNRPSFSHADMPFALDREVHRNFAA